MKKKVKKNKPKLTDRDKIFALEYLIDLSPERAAIAAGYSKTVARTRAYSWVSNSKQKPALFSYVQKLVNKRAGKLEITAEYVLKNIVRIGECCMQAVPVLDKEGNAIGAYVFKEQGALKAQELLGKHLGLFTDVILNGRINSIAKARDFSIV